MMFMAILFSCLTLLFSYILGKSLKKIFFQTMPDFCTSVLGFFAFLGLFQLISFWVVKSQLSTEILIISIGILMLGILILAVISRASLMPTKIDCLGFLFGLSFCIIYFCFALNQTLGEKPFDSVFYLSMVMENSFSPTIGKFLPFSGRVINDFNVLYDFQSYYHFHSMLTKVARDTFFSSVETMTPFYFWNASFLYYYCLGLTTFNAITLFVKKKKVLPILAIVLFVMVLFTNYFNIAFAYYGNTLKTLAAANILLCIYLMFKYKAYSILWLLTFLFGGLIACSSSGFFMSVFLYVALLFALIFNNIKNGKIYFGLSVAALPIAIMASIYFQYGGLITPSPTLSLLVLVAYVIFVLFCFSLRFFKKKGMTALLSLGKGIFYAILIGLIGISVLFQGKMESGYFYFFLPHSRGDMTLDYFTFNNFQGIVRNLLIYGLFIWAFINLKNKDKGFKSVILILLVLFLNPLVCPAVFTLMTNVVYCRAFELLINPVVIVLFMSYIFSSDLKIQGFDQILAGCIAIVSLFFVFTNVTKLYTSYLKPSITYDPIARVTTGESEIYDFLNKEFDELEEKPLVISQDIALKGYVRNLELVFDANDYRSAPIYEDHSIPAPSELMNIFFPRDYFKQEIWNTEPDYSQACPLVKSNEVDYLVMSQKVTIDDDGDGTYAPFWLSVRACSKEIFKNDEYVVLKYVDWAAENARGDAQ